jgi:IS30 family transposase
MPKRRYGSLSPEQRSEVIRLAARGLSYRQIIKETGVSSGSVGRVLAPRGGVARVEDYTPGTGRLSLDDRYEIGIGLAAGETFTTIAERIGRQVSTVSREVGGRAGRDGYRPRLADRAARARACRPKGTKLAGNERLCRRVIEDLEELWSPEQIAERLRDDFPDEPEMWVSHETIYKSLFVQGRGELRKELAACLRTGRAVRRSRGRVELRGGIPNAIPISERPAEIEDRAVPGHWEGDLIVGTANKSAVGTLVERTTRLVMLLHLDGDHRAETVREAMAAKIQTLPATLFRTLTWDRGTEIYFCDPHSPWQRGSNENTNGLLRQYMPKGTDLSVHTQADLDAFADSLNNRPRKTLQWMKPSEAFNQLLASTD